jgi:hypothetical protein
MKYKLGVCVPYRNREEHLKEFIPVISKFLESKDKGESKEKKRAYAEERRRLYHLRHTHPTLREKLGKLLLW